MTAALRQAAQSALEALESLQGCCTDSDDGAVEAITVWCPEVIDNLRAALRSAQAEPVAWRIKLCSPDLGEYVDYKGALAQIPRDSRNWTPLYATPQRVPPAPPVIEESLTTRRSWLRRNG